MPRNFPGGREGHEAFTDGAPAPLVPRALSHLDSPGRSLHVFSSTAEPLPPSSSPVEARMWSVYARFQGRRDGFGRDVRVNL